MWVVTTPILTNILADSWLAVKLNPLAVKNRIEYPTTSYWWLWSQYLLRLYLTHKFHRYIKSGKYTRLRTSIKRHPLSTVESNMFLGIRKRCHKTRKTGVHVFFINLFFLYKKPLMEKSLGRLFIERPCLFPGEVWWSSADK